MRDCYYEQNMGISDFDDEERDSGNNRTENRDVR